MCSTSWQIAPLSGTATRVQALSLSDESRFMARHWQQISLEESQQHPLYGVKNWLALFAFGHVLGPLVILGTLNNSANDAGLTLRQLLSAPSVGNFATGTLLVFGVASFVTLQLMFTKHRDFRTVATTLLVAVWPAFLLMAYFTGGWNLPGFGGDAAKGTFSQLAVIAIWGTYLQRSRRVRVTFENCVVAMEVPASKSQEGRLAKGVPAPVPAREALTTGGAADLKSDSGPSEEFWSEASVELESTSRRPGLWARVFSEAQGNESLAKANYLRYRALELQQQHDAQFEQARRDVEEAARVAAIAQQAAKEHADAAVPKGICPNCNAVVPLGVKRCPKCPAVFGPQSAWALRPVMASMEANPSPAGRVAAVPGDVPPWVTRFMLTMAGVAVIGIVAAVALPAYQDYTRRQEASVNTPAAKTAPPTRPADNLPMLDLSEFTPVPQVNNPAPIQSQNQQAFSISLEKAVAAIEGEIGSAYNYQLLSMITDIESRYPVFRTEAGQVASRRLKAQIDEKMAGFARPEPQQRGRQQQTNQVIPKPPAVPPAASIPQLDQARTYSAQEKADLDAVSARALSDYPYLDTPAGQEVVNKIVRRRDELIRQGIYPAIALTRAVNDFAPAYAPVAARDAPQATSAEKARPANHNSFPAGCRWVTPQEWSCK